MTESNSAALPFGYSSTYYLLGYLPLDNTYSNTHHFECQYKKWNKFIFIFKKFALKIPKPEPALQMSIDQQKSFWHRIPLPPDTGAKLKHHHS